MTNYCLKSKMSYLIRSQTLKLVSAIFIQIFNFSPNDSLSKTMKNIFYFIQKALSVLEIFRFLYFRLPLFSLSAITLEVDPR